MDKVKNTIWNVLFTECSEKQVEFVQNQIDCFKNYDTPIYNINMLQFQLKIALIMNIYLSYLLIIERDNVIDYFFESFIGTSWFAIICLQNIIIVIPKIVMMIMLSHVVTNSKNIDELTINVVLFMKTKVYYYNCYISRYIWINYGVGVAYWSFNQCFGYQESAEQIVQLCHYVLYLMIGRLVLFFIKIYFQSKGLAKDLLERFIQTKQFTVDEQFNKTVDDCCSVCLEDYNVGDIAINLDCTHFYHIKCIQPWLSIQNKCPQCNKFAFKEL